MLMGIRGAGPDLTAAMPRFTSSTLGATTTLQKVPMLKVPRQRATRALQENETEQFVEGKRMSWQPREANIAFLVREFEEGAVRFRRIGPKLLMRFHPCVSTSHLGLGSRGAPFASTGEPLCKEQVFCTSLMELSHEHTDLRDAIEFVHNTDIYQIAEMLVRGVGICWNVLIATVPSAWLRTWLHF